MNNVLQTLTLGLSLRFASSKYFRTRIIVKHFNENSEIGYFLTILDLYCKQMVACTPKNLASN